MILLSDEEQINGKYTSVALGVFDGVHRGHKAVIDAAAKNAAANDLSAAVCTFRTARAQAFVPFTATRPNACSLNTRGQSMFICPIFPA